MAVMGKTTFALPNLRGRIAPFIPRDGHLVPLGQSGGEATHALTLAEMPAHNHSLAVNSGGGTTDNPANNYLAANSEGIKHYSNSAGSNANTASIGNTGTGSSPAHNNMPPYLGIYHIICLSGYFPTRP